MLLTSGIAEKGDMVTFTGAAMLALMRFAVACVITREGTNIVPPPKVNVIASPGATRPINTPVAPALVARSIFRLMAQDPRSMSATLPAGLSRYGSSADPGVIESAGHPRPT